MEGSLIHSQQPDDLSCGRWRLLMVLISLRGLISPV